MVAFISLAGLTKTPSAQASVAWRHEPTDSRANALLVPLHLNPRNALHSDVIPALTLRKSLSLLSKYLLNFPAPWSSTSAWVTGQLASRLHIAKAVVQPSRTTNVVEPRTLLSFTQAADQSPLAALAFIALGLTAVLTQPLITSHRLLRLSNQPLFPPLLPPQW